MNFNILSGNFNSPCYQSILNDTEVRKICQLEETKVAGPSGPRISTGPAGQSLFCLTGPTVNILATGQRLRQTLQPGHFYVYSTENNPDNLPHLMQNHKCLNEIQKKTRKNCFRYQMRPSVQQPISKDKNVMARTRKYYLKNNYLTLRSKVKVQ